MAEPIPSASNAGDDESSNKLPDNAEDRKAAKALDALNANEMSQENGETATKQPSAADQEALGKAMSRLEIASGISKKTDTNKKADAKKEAEVKKKVKIASEDVNFLVTELDLTKNKATELLRTHDGNADAVVRAFIAPTVKARGGCVKPVSEARKLLPKRRPTCGWGSRDWNATCCSQDTAIFINASSTCLTVNSLGARNRTRIL